jgi:sporulation protein YlmC with PRC-barrel domain
MTMVGGRVLDLHLHLLDRQVIDRDGQFVCKVDDLELEADESGNLLVTGIVVGARGLGPRLGGRLGRWVSAIAGRIATEPTLVISFSHVSEIGNAVTVGSTRADLQVDPLEQWVEQHIISRIPGSGHASS